MVRYCFICKEYLKADMYHRFPAGGDIRKKWLGAFGFEEDDVFKNTLVCSNHFNNDCYHVPNHLTGNRVLKKGSIPSLLLAVQKVKKTPRKRVNINQPSTSRIGQSQLSIQHSQLSFSESTSSQYLLYPNVIIQQPQVTQQTPFPGFLESRIKNEILEDNASMEDERIKYEIPEDSSCSTMNEEMFDKSVIIKQELIHENEKHLYTINYENIKLEEELHTELTIKNEMLEDNVTMKEEILDTSSI